MASSSLSYMHTDSADDAEDEEPIQQFFHSSQPSSSPIALSRCWAQQSAHNPFYSGGKVTHGHIKHSTSAVTSFFLTPYVGDLCIVDANTGCKVCTLRKGYADDSSSSFRPKSDTEGDEEDENEEAEGESIDADAIVSYTLAPNQIDLITASRNQIIRQYNLSGVLDQSGRSGAVRIQKTLGKSGHDLPITHMEFHESSIFFATGAVDGKVKVWDLRGGFITHSFHRIIAQSPSSSSSSVVASSVRGRGGVTGLQWCQDISKLWLAIGRDDGTIQIHDLRQQGNPTSRHSDPVCMAHLTDHVSAVTCMIWSPLLDIFISAGRDAVINIWSISVQETVQTKEDVLLKQASSQKEKNSKVNKRLKKESLKIAPSEESMTSFSYRYKRIFTHPIYEQIELGMVLIPPNVYQLPNDMSHQDMILATAGTKGIVRLWKIIRDTEHIGSAVTDMTLWRQQSIKSAFGENRGGYTNLLLKNTSEYKASSTFSDELIAVDAEHNISFIPLDESSSHLSPRRTIVGHNDEILDLKIIPPVSIGQNQESSPENQQYRIAVATNSAQVRIFDLGTFSSHTLNGHADTVLSLDVSPCGRFLATCGKDKMMRIWLIETSTCVAIARGHTDAIGTTAFSRKTGRYDVRGKAVKSGAGAFAVTASNDNTLKRWNLPGASDLIEISCKSSQGMEEKGPSPVIELRVFASVKAHEKDMNIVRVAPNDSLIATGSQDKTVKLWDFNDLTLRGTLRGHKRGVWDCQFSPYDKVVATSSGDKTVKLWSLGDFSCVRTFQGHLSTVLRVRFLCGGLQLVSSGSDGLVKLWTIRTNECEGTMDGHRDKIWALDLSPDGTTLVSGGADSKIVVWKDITVEIQEEKREEEEKNILLEQKLANHLRFKEYNEALDIALEMDKPRQALKVFVSIIENDTREVGSVHTPTTLQKYIKTWSMDRITQVLRYCREWNTRARNSNIAMTIINSIFAVFPARELIVNEGIPEILAGIIPYAERHFDRIDKLSESSYLVDFVLSAMGILFTEENEEKDSYTTWAAASKLVLPEAKQVVIKVANEVKAVSTQVASYDDEIVTVGDSSSSDESD